MPQNFFNLFEYTFCIGGPDKGLGGFVIGTYVIDYGFAQVRDAGERSTSDDLESDFGKEVLHLVKPAGMGWDKRQLPARMTQ